MSNSIVQIMLTDATRARLFCIHFSRFFFLLFYSFHKLSIEKKNCFETMRPEGIRFRIYYLL